MKVRYDVLQLDDSGHPTRRVDTFEESAAVDRIQAPSIHAWESVAKLSAEKCAAMSAARYPGVRFVVRTIAESDSRAFFIPLKPRVAAARRERLQTSAKLTGTSR